MSGTQMTHHYRFSTETQILSRFPVHVSRWSGIWPSATPQARQSPRNSILSLRRRTIQPEAEISSDTLYEVLRYLCNRLYHDPNHIHDQTAYYSHLKWIDWALPRGQERNGSTTKISPPLCQLTWFFDSADENTVIALLGRLDNKSPHSLTETQYRHILEIASDQLHSRYFNGWFHAPESDPGVRQSPWTRVLTLLERAEAQMLEHIRLSYPQANTAIPDYSAISYIDTLQQHVASIRLVAEVERFTSGVNPADLWTTMMDDRFELTDIVFVLQNVFILMALFRMCDYPTTNRALTGLCSKNSVVTLRHKTGMYRRLTSMVFPERLPMAFLQRYKLLVDSTHPYC